MFNGYKTPMKLTTLDVSNWKTSKVTDMSYMFSQCANLTSLDVSKWDTSNVTDMEYMFQGCSELTSLDASNWDTSKVSNMEYMFYACSKLIKITVTNCSQSTKEKLLKQLKTDTGKNWILDENDTILKRQN